MIILLSNNGIMDNDDGRLSSKVAMLSAQVNALEDKIYESLEIQKQNAKYVFSKCLENILNFLNMFEDVFCSNTTFSDLLGGKVCFLVVP